MLFKAKFIIGIILLICTCLPLGSCQDKAIQAERQKVETNAENIEQTKPEEIEYLIPIRNIEASNPYSWGLFISMAWILPFLLICRTLGQNKKGKISASIMELIFVGCSVYILYSALFALWFEPMVYGYAAIILLGFYLIICVFELLSLLKNIKYNKSLEKDAP